MDKPNDQEGNEVTLEMENKIDNKEMLIIDDMMRKMEKEELIPGSKLPSEYELVDRYQVPRITVRNALVKLEERGYIYSIHGKGRYVKEKAIPIQLPLNGSTSFTEKMKSMGYDYRAENIDFTLIPYHPNLFNRLQANQTDRVYRIGRLRYMNKEPIAIHYSFVKETDFPNIEVDGPAIQSMFAYYRQQGIKAFSSKRSLLSVAFPTIDEQRLLQCKSMVPLIGVETDSYDKENDKLLEYTRILYRSDRFKYDITSV